MAKSTMSLRQKIEKAISKASKTDLRVGSVMLNANIRQELMSVGLKELEQFSYEGFNFSWYANAMGMKDYNILIVKL